MKFPSLRIFIPSVAAFALAGCIADDSAPRAEYKGLFSCDVNEPPPAAPAREEAAAHFGPWGWDELAIRAGERSDATRVAYIDAAVRRLRAEEDVQWKDPELRFGQDWGRSRQRSWERHADPLENDSSLESGDGYSSSIGVRFYVPNPFVERYARAKADAEGRKELARAAVEAYEVYCEVKMLCFEAVRTQNEIRYLEERAKAWGDLKQAAEASYANGVFSSPLDAIRAETKLAKAAVKLSTVTSERNALIRRIAWLAGVSPEGLEIDETLPNLPAPDQLTIDHMTEIAFARRPDLAAAVAEVEEAEAGVEAARAANIPWFRFVEATYQHSNDSSSEHEYARYEHSRSHDNEFGLKASLYLPIFTWAGQSLELSKTVRERANARLDSLYASIRCEVETAYSDYVEAASRVRTKETAEFIDRMNARIEEYNASDAAMAEETSKAYEELIDYKNLESETRLVLIESALRLESVIGGPLPVLAAAAAKTEPVAEETAAPEAVVASAAEGDEAEVVEPADEAGAQPGDEPEAAVPAEAKPVEDEKVEAVPGEAEAAEPVEPVEEETETKEPQVACALVTEPLDFEALVGEL